MSTQFSPKIHPLSFLRVVAAEYLAAYQLSGALPAPVPETLRLQDADEFLTTEAEEEELGPLAEVIDISEHPDFDPVELNPELRAWWHDPANAQPSLGA